MGLVIVAVSYQGTLTVNFTLCPDVVAGGESLTTMLEDSLDAIEVAAANLSEDTGDSGFETEEHTTLMDDALTLMEGALRKTVARFRN
jgi:hypothetical protein